MNFTAKDKEKLDQTSSDVSYIRGRLDEALPLIQSNDAELFKKTNDNANGITELKTAQSSCPARKAYNSRFQRMGSWIAAGALVVSLAILIVMLVQTMGCTAKRAETDVKTTKTVEETHAEN